MEDWGPKDAILQTWIKSQCHIFTRMGGFACLLIAARYSLLYRRGVFFGHVCQRLWVGINNLVPEVLMTSSSSDDVGLSSRNAWYKRSVQECLWPLISSIAAAAAMRRRRNGGRPPPFIGLGLFAALLLLSGCRGDGHSKTRLTFFIGSFNVPKLCFFSCSFLFLFHKKLKRVRVEANLRLHGPLQRKGPHRILHGDFTYNSDRNELKTISNLLFSRY